MTYVSATIAILCGIASLEFLREWNRGGWLTRIYLNPRDGLYEAKFASAAAGVWYVFAGSSMCSMFALIGAEEDLGLRAPDWLVLGLAIATMAFFLVGLVVWLTMPNGFVVPRPIRGAPGYLAYKGWAGH